MRRRCAIHFNVTVISRLNRPAIRTFLGSPFRRRSSSPCFHRSFLNSCAIAFLPGGLPASPRQRVQEKLPIRIILEDNLAPVTPVHHVMERPRIFHPQLSRHGAKPGKQAFCVNTKNRPRFNRPAIRTFLGSPFRRRSSSPCFQRGFLSSCAIAFLPGGLPASRRKRNLDSTGHHLCWAKRNQT
jgi:hypothetical protein